jgi:hypothetical protein
MMSRMDRLRPLSRLFREAVAIFLGVAAALAGQAWFEARADRAAERGFLQGVLEELAATEHAAIETQGYFEQQRETAVGIAVLLSRPPAPAIVDSISRLAALPSVARRPLTKGTEP